VRKAFVMSVVLLIIVCSTFANIKTRTLTREDYYLSGPVSSVSYVVYDVKTSFGKESYVKSDYYYEASFDEAGRVVTEKQNSEHKGEFYEEGSFSLAFAPFGNPVQFPPIYSFAVEFREFSDGYLDSFRRLYALFSGTSPVIDPSFLPLESTRQTEFMYDEFGKLLSVEFYEGSDLDYYQKYSYGDSGLLERVELYQMPFLSGDTSGPRMVTFVVFEYDESQRIKIRYNHRNTVVSPDEWETAVLYSYDSQGNVVGVDFYTYGDSSRKVDSVKLSYESERLTSIETFKKQVVTLIYGEDSRLHQVILENNAPYPTLGFVVEYSDKGLVSRFEKYRFSGEWKLAFTEELSYEFDVYGNWTTLTFYQNKEEMGKVQRVPSLLVNRIITYNE